MNEEQIIKLWKIGYSKNYIVDLLYRSYKGSEKFKGYRAKEIREKAYNDLELILLREYRKNNKG